MFSRILRPVCRQASGAARNYHGPNNFKPVTMNEMPVPNGSWQEAYNSKQRKYNMHLIGGLSFFIFTIGVTCQSGLIRLDYAPKLK